jgi:enediyne biosynthesis protein E4
MAANTADLSFPGKMRGVSGKSPIAAALLACMLLWPGCRQTPTAPDKNLGDANLAAKVPAAAPIGFKDLAAAAGIQFKLGTGAKSPLNILETAGGGCAFIDYDRDGWPDIFLVGPHSAALYHNERNGTFKDVTSASGIATDRYWMGCAVGDFNGDGLPDLFLTGYHCFALYKNLGNGRFQDVTKESGISGLTWSMGAAFADLTGTGRLDLFVGQYVDFESTSPGRDLCRVGKLLSACGPEVYNPLHGRLFQNLDGRHFKQIPWPDTGKTWGVLASDLLEIGKPSLYEANDMMPGDLWSLAGGHRKNIGPNTGTSYDGQGHVQGAMAVDSGDYDNDGHLDLLVTTYYAQSASLYHNDGGGLFSSVSGPAGLSAPTLPFVKFGAAFADFDNDGWLDILMTSGHIRDNVSQIDSAQSFRQPVQLFHNIQGRFEEIPIKSGASNLLAVGRGLSIADYDHDGKLDALVVDLEGRPLLLHNVSQNKNNWLEIQLEDLRNAGNRDGLGAIISAECGSKKQIREIRTCGSVLSGLFPAAHFGFGTTSGTVKLTIRWPDGSVQPVVNVPQNKRLIIKKGQNGISSGP